MQVNNGWSLSHSSGRCNRGLIHDIHEILPLNEMAFGDPKCRNQYVKI
jgi:hypothetical protein